MKNFFKNFKRVLVETKDGVKSRVSWVLNYSKLNDEWYEESLENDILKVNLGKKITKLENEKIDIFKERDNLLKLRDERVQQLNEHVSNQRNEIKALATKLQDKNKIIDNLEKEVEEKELARRVNAGKIGGLVTYNNKLKEELEIANKKIEFLKTHRRAPSIAEQEAYEYNQREVLKRQNERKN